MLTWFDREKRDLPWRRTRDPYAILVSEVMLQQTRVAAAIAYFERFVKRFPNFGELAAASEAEVLTYWAGLGYYYRARNLHHAAKLIAARGHFPSDHASIRQLPGVGDYTAAAVASIAFAQPYASVDGNAIRVLSRIFDDTAAADSPSGRKHFQLLASQILDSCRPGDFNQAVMELGATICLPSNPKCLVCPVVELCHAQKRGTQLERPVKREPTKTVRQHRTVYWIEENRRVLVWQRSSNERLMAGFWELPEADQLSQVEVTRTVGQFRHAITFHDYRFQLCEAKAPGEIGGCHWIDLSELESLPVSTILKKARRLRNKLIMGETR